MNEGDMESIRELAKENGIDAEDAEDYIAGDMQEFVTVSGAAFGRMSIEEKEAKANKGEEMVVRVIFSMARSMCLKESFCSLVVRKGKRLMDVYQIMRNEAQKHKSNSVAVCCGTDRELENLITEYYTGGKDAAEKYMKTLYGETGGRE